MNAQLKKLFNLDEHIISFYKVLYWHSDVDYVRGFLSLTRHHIVFHADAGAEDPESRYNTLIPFKDVTSIEATPSKRIFTAETVTLTTNTDTKVLLSPSNNGY